MAADFELTASDMEKPKTASETAMLLAILQEIQAARAIELSAALSNRYGVFVRAITRDGGVRLSLFIRHSANK